MSATHNAALESVSLVYSPYHVGLRDEGPGAGPGFLRSHGLAQSLRDMGVTVNELEIEPVDDFEGEIGRGFEILRRTSALVTQERDRGSFPIVLSGNCSATVGVAAGLSASRGLQRADLGCVWFDAHDDYNTPDTVMSGYFDSMGVAMLTGECWKGLLSTVPGHRPLNIEKIVHVGMRDVTPLERQRVVESGMEVVWGSTEERVAFADRLCESLMVKNLGLTPTMIHIDLDCLDTSIGRANKFAAPGGLLGDDLLGCLRRMVSVVEPVSLTVASLDPSYDGAERFAELGIDAVRMLVKILVNEQKITQQL